MEAPLPLPVAILESGTVIRPEFVSLARELAMDIEDEEVIRARYNLTEEQVAAVKQHPKFKVIYDAYVIEWQSATNTEHRLKVKSQALLEAGIVKFGAMVTGDATSTSDRIEAAKVLMKAGGIGEKISGGGSNERFSIQIHIGGDGADAKTIEATALPSVGEGEGSEAPVRSIPPTTIDGSAEAAAGDAGRTGSAGTLRTLPQGTGFAIPLPIDKQEIGSTVPLQPLPEGD